LKEHYKKCLFVKDVIRSLKEMEQQVKGYVINAAFIQKKMQLKEE
jgi:hypothetical protein|tara:strand:- start:1927 stop:2061 length:135 start_codon:yes stop_codon:yes gene_type:complete